jgi:hypothetical protein
MGEDNPFPARQQLENEMFVCQDRIRPFGGAKQTRWVCLKI